MALPTALTVFLVAGILVSLAVALVAVWEYPHPLAVPIVVLTGGAALWAIPYLVGIHSSDPTDHLWLQRVRHLGTALVPVAFYTVAARYSGDDRLTRPGVLAAIGAVPIATLVLVWTSNYHDLVWRSIGVDGVSGVYTTTFEYGPWFPLHLFWLYGILLLSLGLLGRAHLRNGTHRRKQVLLMFVGGSVPFVLNGMHQLGVGLAGRIDPTPIAIVLGGAIVGIGVLLFDFVQLRPIARDRLIEQLHDGVIIHDTVGRVRDSNPVARRILAEEGIDPASLDGPIAAHGSELDVTIDGEERRYRVEIHSLTDPTGHDAGRIVYLHDITEVARREQRISVLHRVLRHNIRNEMTVLLGHLEYVQQEAEAHASEDLRAVERSADRIMGFADNARLIERTLKRENGTGHVAIRDCIEASIAAVRDDADEIEVGYGSTPTDLQVTAVDRELLERALGELIENAIVHGSGTPEVRLEREDDWLDVKVIDEGEGIPDGELRALDAPVETALDHGSGLGLWVARWTADLSGGELHFGREGRTNVVSLRLPVTGSEESLLDGEE